jgi:hypothetical protein
VNETHRDRCKRCARFCGVVVQPGGELDGHEGGGGRAEREHVGKEVMKKYKREFRRRRSRCARESDE